MISTSLRLNLHDEAIKHKINERMHMRAKRLWLSMAVLIMTAFWALTQGSINIDWIELIKSLATALFAQKNAIEPLAPQGQVDYSFHHYVLMQLRLPRVLMALMLGAMLSMAGCVMQGLVRNPLADPGLIGISGGAAAAAAVSMTIAPLTSVLVGVSFLSAYWTAIWAFAGALLSVWFVVTLASSKQRVSVATLILAGVAINALSGTVIGAVSYIASDDALRQISYWTMGSLSGANWQNVGFLCVVLVISTGIFMRCREALNLFALGEQDATVLGLNTTQYKKIMLWTVAFSVAIATATAGIIGFVGLVVPHICRALFGADHRYLVPACGLLGALLLIIADTLARSLFAPMEIPIGIITSAIGAPFFMYLLWQSKGAKENA